MQRMTVEYLPVDAVKPYAGNPRRNKRAVAGVATCAEEALALLEEGEKIHESH